MILDWENDTQDSRQITVDSMINHYEKNHAPFILYTPKGIWYEVIDFKMFKRDDGSWKTEVYYQEADHNKRRKVTYIRSIEQLQDKFALIP